MGLTLLWVLNFAISWFNAWACGQAWNESKKQGGFPHLTNWAGAIMSASGFSWCYMVVLAWFGATVPFTDKKTHVVSTLLSQADLQAFCDLGYAVIVIPIIGSGLIIMLDTWAHFYRKRTIGNALLSGYNTFAQLHNMYSAAQHLPGVFTRLGDFFFAKGSKDGKGKLIIALVVLSVAGGILTARAILLASAGSRARRTSDDLHDAEREFKRRERERGHAAGSGAASAA